jgi:catechol 2,3-dioxygenase-like lactoylglutathione lyase family enzyme
MSISRLDHVYAETHDWNASVAFWEALGFTFADRWGTDGHRAGRLEAGDAVVVLAEVASDVAPAFNVFFDLADPDEYELAEGAEVVTPLEATHWGTQWIRVRDPEGRVHCLEAQSGE